MKNPRALVATILALTVLAFTINGTVLPMALDRPVSTEGYDAWSDLINVLIGGLIGYIMGGSNDKA